MIYPSQATVMPRAVCPTTGDTLPLQSLIEGFIAARDTGAIGIVGSAGAGKTTALGHLAKTLCPGKPILYLDDASVQDVASARPFRIVIYTRDQASPMLADTSFELARWGQDELIEYLLAAHPARCNSIMLRIRTEAIGHEMLGIPELWRVVLDRMAHDEAANDARTILNAELDELLSSYVLKATARHYGLTLLRGAPALAQLRRKDLMSQGADERLPRLLRHRIVQCLLATALLSQNLIDGIYKRFNNLPHELIREVALAARRSVAVLGGLNSMIEHADEPRQATAASILHATDNHWTPHGPPFPSLARAQLAGARWPGLKIPGISLMHANLAGADLSDAMLTDARATGCRLTGACLRGADLTGICLAEAELSRADLAGASLKCADLTATDLTSASLRSAYLCGADLRRARVEGADFSGANLALATLAGLNLREANLSKAIFVDTCLANCDLEGMRLRSPDFTHADLTKALLTGSVFPRANFQRACLRGAGLADIHWERADLRQADLRECSFFLGSSRSGLVGSPLACEGSRTGFYTDDFDDQAFKSPEEIRKANLRGADLQGAIIEGVDFYLVDLRNAKYDRKQAKHLRRCGAILSKQALA